MPFPRSVTGRAVATATAFTVLALALASAAVAAAFDAGPGRAFLGTMSTFLMPIAVLVLLAAGPVHVRGTEWARYGLLAARSALAVLVIVGPLRHAVTRAMGAPAADGVWLTFPSALVMGAALTIVLSAHASRTPLVVSVTAAACAIAHAALARVAPGSLLDTGSLWLALVLFAGAFAGAFAIALAPDADAAGPRARAVSER